VAQIAIAPDYEPFAKQFAFHGSSKRFKVAAAGNRGGKTKSGSVDFLGRIAHDAALGRGQKAVRLGNSRVPRLNYWVVTPTHRLGEYPYREIMRHCPREWIESVNASTRTIWLKGEIKIEFQTSERPELLVAASLNGIWMDEACRCKAEAWRGGLRARIADQQGWALFTTTPLGGRNNWVYQELVSKAGIDPHVDAFHWTTEENPHIPRAEIEHARATQPPEWFARDWLASWDSFGGSIYGELSDAHICTEQELRFRLGWGQRPLREAFRRIVAGVDFGLTAAGAIVVVGHLGDSRMVFLDESYAPGRHITHGAVSWVSEAKRLRDLWGVERFYCDPADPSKIMDLRVAGLPVQGASNNVHKGIRRVAESLHVVDNKPQSFVLSGCKNLIRELRNYQWRPTKDQSGFYEDPADGQSDHACDAARYAVVGLRPFVEDGQRQQGASFIPPG
jgi:hypothetical protein